MLVRKEEGEEVLVKNAQARHSQHPVQSAETLILESIVVNKLLVHDQQADLVLGNHPSFVVVNEFE